MTEEFGKVHVLTGPGRCKTTSAFGLAMRASGHGLKVRIVQFMKAGGTTGEVIAAKRLKGLEVAQFGTGNLVDFKSPSKDDIRCAAEGMECARKALDKGGFELLILDEINIAASIGLVAPEDVLRLIRTARAKGIEVVLTGRNAPLEFIEVADYVSIVESMKHPLDEGLKARKGVEW